MDQPHLKASKEKKLIFLLKGMNIVKAFNMKNKFLLKKWWENRTTAVCRRNLGNFSGRDNPKNQEPSQPVIYSQNHACMFLLIYACKYSSVPGLICIAGSQYIFACICTQFPLFIHAQSYLFMHPCNFDLLLPLWVPQVLITLVTKLQFKIYHIESYMWNEDNSLSSWNTY